jgi:diacylglycerol kinase family enzyme
VVLNLRSGPFRRTGHSELVELFAEHSIGARIFPADTGAAVRAGAETAAEQGYSIIVAAGGDGTVGTVAPIVARAGKMFGVLPLGTFNHFARDLSIPVDVAAAVEVLKSRRTVCVDLASVNGRPFINTSSIGLYPRLVLESEHYRRSGLAYWAALPSAAISTQREFSRISVRLQASGREWEGVTPFVFVGNNIYTLERRRIGSRPRLDGGVLWVCATFESSRWRFLELAIDTVRGRVEKNPNFKTLSTRELFVDSNRRKLYVSLDGEVELLSTPLHYNVHHRALRVIVP